MEGRIEGLKLITLIGIDRKKLKIGANVNLGVKSEYLSLLSGIKGTNKKAANGEQAIESALKASCRIVAE